MIEVIDNVLEEHNAILVDDYVKQLSWKYDYHSEPTKPNKHWHVLCGHDEGECVAAGYDWAHYIFKVAKKKLDRVDSFDYERIYCNAHTHGIEPHLHIDDGQLVEYVGNRLVIFDAHLPHKAMTVSRECYELRTNVVFKCHV